MLFTSISKLRRERNIRPLLGILSIAGALAAGVFAGWHIIVVQHGWPLSFGEIFYATVHYDIYGELEGAAEDYIFFMLFLGNLGAMLAGITGWLIAKFRQKTPLID